MRLPAPLRRLTHDDHRRGHGHRTLAALARRRPGARPTRADASDRARPTARESRCSGAGRGRRASRPAGGRAGPRRRAGRLVTSPPRSPDRRAADRRTAELTLLLRDLYARKRRRLRPTTGRRRTSRGPSASQRLRSGEPGGQSVLRALGHAHGSGRPAARGHRPANGIPDQVDRTRKTLTDVWRESSPTAATAPPPDGGRGPRPEQQRFDVYLGDVGRAGPLRLLPRARDRHEHVAVRRGRLLHARRRLQPPQFPTNTPLENLQVTAAHEFFHAVQFAYDAYEDGWFIEGTADLGRGRGLRRRRRQPPVPPPQPAAPSRRRPWTARRTRHLRQLDLVALPHRDATPTQGGSGLPLVLSRCGSGLRRDTAPSARSALLAPGARPRARGPRHLAPGRPGPTSHGRTAIPATSTTKGALPPRPGGARYSARPARATPPAREPSPLDHLAARPRCAFTRGGGWPRRLAAAVTVDMPEPAGAASRGRRHPRRRNGTHAQAVRPDSRRGRQGRCRDLLGRHPPSSS